MWPVGPPATYRPGHDRRRCDRRPAGHNVRDARARPASGPAHPRLRDLPGHRRVDRGGPDGDGLGRPLGHHAQHDGRGRRRARPPVRDQQPVPGRSRTGRPDADAPGRRSRGDWHRSSGRARSCGSRSAGPTGGSWPPTTPRRVASSARRRPTSRPRSAARPRRPGSPTSRLSEAAGTPLATSDVVREYFPLITDGQVRGVVGVWRDAAPILATLDAVRWNVVLVTLSAGLIAAIVLYLVFRSAQGRITRQTAALVDALDRDTLTGTLNHGALVDPRRDGHRARPRDRRRDRRRAHRHRQLPVAQRDVRPRRRRRGAPDRRRRPAPIAARRRRLRTLRAGRVPRGRPGRLGPPHDRRPRADARRARRPLAPVRRLRAPAADRQRRRVPVPRSRRLRDGAPDRHGPDPPGGEGERRRRRPGRRPADRERARRRARSTSSRA